MRIAWAVYGDHHDASVPTVVLVPTWSIVPSRFWKLQVGYLARHFRVVTFDGRGSGASSRPVGAAAYTDAEYFGRNARTIAVLLDRDAVASGAAAAGAPWQFYDLGHGYCSYSFFEQCPHRLACPRCDFYVPKASSRGLLLEAQTNL